MHVSKGLPMLCRCCWLVVLTQPKWSGLAACGNVLTKGQDTGGKTARSYAAAHTHVQSILPASAPMGKTTSRQDSGGNSEPVSPTALRRMSLSKKFGAGSAGDQEVPLHQGVKSFTDVH